MILGESKNRLWECDNSTATQVKWKTGTSQNSLAQGKGLEGICLAQAIVWAMNVLKGKSPQDSKPSQFESGLKMSRFDVMGIVNREAMKDSGLKVVRWKETPSYANARDWMMGGKVGDVFMVGLDGRSGGGHQLAFANLAAGKVLFDPNFGLYSFASLDDIRTALIEAARAVGVHPVKHVHIDQVTLAG